MTYQKKKIAIIAKTYPNLSEKYEETVCVAGINLDTNEWIRMFPIMYRKLPMDKHFKKFDVIEVEAEPHKDKYLRQESHKVIDKTIRVLASFKSPEWDNRKGLLLPKLNQSIEELEDLRDSQRQTIGIIKPKIIDFYKKPIESCRDWEKELIEGTQKMLFGEQYKSPLDKIPYWMGYRFTCNDERCSGHDLMCEDWEMIQLFRTERAKLGNDELAFGKVRDRYFDWMQQRDIYFVVGTESRWNHFLIISLFYPPIVQKSV